MVYYNNLDIMVNLAVSLISLFTKLRRIRLNNFSRFTEHNANNNNMTNIIIIMYRRKNKQIKICKTGTFGLLT